MSASTSTSVSISLPTVQQLLSAVLSSTAPDLAIQKLFHSDLDTVRNRSSSIMDDRIADARRLGQIVQGAPLLSFSTN